MRSRNGQFCGHGFHYFPQTARFHGFAGHRAVSMIGRHLYNGMASSYQGGVHMGEQRQRYSEKFKKETVRFV
ncbi:hypothetical protein ACE4RR_14215, partial [Alteribacillus sp. HJP-4]